MESLVIQFLMVNEISDLWFDYLIRKSDKEDKMNIPAVASKQNQMKKMDYGSALSYCAKKERFMPQIPKFLEEEGEEEGVNPAIFVFRRKASKEEAMLGLNSLKLHIKITRVALENQWIE